VIRLGSLAGYPFEGPRVLAGWTPPARAAVYAILYKPDVATEKYAVIYVGQSADLSTGRFPFGHPRASCWTKRAGDRYKLYIATYEVPGGLVSHRDLIVNELAAIYKPGCNETEYTSSWKDEWIAGWTAPTTGPLTTNRDASE
jgi:hypothetical protein